MAAEIAPAEHRAQKIQYQCCKRYPNSPQLYTETVIFEQKAFQRQPARMPYHACSDALDASSRHHVHCYPSARSPAAAARQATQ